MKGRTASRLRQKIGSLHGAAKIYHLAMSIRLQCVRISGRVPYQNIYYCCTQRTASQWLRRVFRDPVVRKYSGLRVIPYTQIGLNYASFNRPFPKGSLATHLYISYPVYLTIPKPDTYRTFFIMRDPRDIVTSWYFAAKYSHVPIPPVPEMRNMLREMPQEEGFKYIIDKLDEWGSFEAQRSWMNARHEDNIRIFYFEDIAENFRSFLNDLLAYLAIQIPEEQFTTLCSRHEFRKYSGWRAQGVEDRYSHYRKGISGDWKNYFTRELQVYFRDKTGDLLEVLGYRQ